MTVRFVLGPGAAGLRREAYDVGWVQVGDLPAEGWTPARLAHLPIAAAPEVIEAALRVRLARLG
ncbi:hypothetical protein [Deinococcus sp.]|uniref:hypothetical protein n=1 Tax=Deinococcus sp. TaxID=47478 RepID=UPI003B5ABE62